MTLLQEQSHAFHSQVIPKRNTVPGGTEVIFQIWKIQIFIVAFDTILKSIKLNPKGAFIDTEFERRVVP